MGPPSEHDFPVIRVSDLTALSNFSRVGGGGG